MSQQGPNLPGTGQDAGGGSSVWTSPNNITTEESFANQVFLGNPNPVKDSVIRIYNGSARIGENKADTGTDWPVFVSGSPGPLAIYGGSNDKWGLTTELDGLIATSNFGIDLETSHNTGALRGSNFGFSAPSSAVAGLQLEIARSYALISDDTVAVVDWFKVTVFEQNGASQSFVGGSFLGGGLG